MAYSGKIVPRLIRKTFDAVIKARNITLDFIRKELKNKNFPRTSDIDKVVRDYFESLNLGKFFVHGTGHSFRILFMSWKIFLLVKK